jgi:hypothetical protein
LGVLGQLASRSWVTPKLAGREFGNENSAAIEAEGRGAAATEEPVLTQTLTSTSRERTNRLTINKSLLTKLNLQFRLTLVSAMAQVSRRDRALGVKLQYRCLYLDALLCPSFFHCRSNRFSIIRGGEG